MASGRRRCWAGCSRSVGRSSSVERPGCWACRRCVRPASIAVLPAECLSVLLSARAFGHMDADEMLCSSGRALAFGGSPPRGPAFGLVGSGSAVSSRVRERAARYGCALSVGVGWVWLRGGEPPGCPFRREARRAGGSLVAGNPASGSSLRERFALHRGSLDGFARPGASVGPGDEGEQA